MKPSATSLSRQIEVVSRALRRYADRGVFRGYGERPLASGRCEYHFLWLTERPYVLRFEARSRRLTFCDLLPNVPYPSAMDRELRRFLRGRTSTSLPPHRRLDPDCLELECRNRGGDVSVSLVVKGGDYAYGVRKAIALCNEIHFNFLSGPYEAYMVRNFNLPEE